MQALKPLKNDCSLCQGPNGSLLRDAWGCNPTSSLPEKDRFLYDLGGVKTFRCPISLMNLPFVQTALNLYETYTKGITPKGKGMSQETAVYRKVMSTVSNLSESAERWYNEELKKKKKS